MVKQAIQVVDADVIAAYDGFTKGASHRTYLDLENNTSVRPSYSKHDYNAFRGDEASPTRHKDLVKRCLSAYENVGLVQTVINLMSDFSSQGIGVVHPRDSVQLVLDKWCNTVKFAERSERFMNTFYKCGSAIVHRKYGGINLNGSKKRIASQYTILNPLVVEVKNPIAALFYGKFTYVMKPPSLYSSFSDGLIGTDIGSDMNSLSLLNQSEIPLNTEDLRVFHYKKDDWKLWGSPLISPILDDLTMLEKMKLADTSALDGAISNIRLWNLGHLDGPNSILPTKASIDRLRNILAQNVGGGTMDIVWGPELKFTESNTQVYKFLGDTKYTPVLNSIYAGLGVPPTMTGLASTGGSFSNNFISLKTLIDRLQYGRSALIQFWKGELELLQKQMGFRDPAVLRFDHMTLNDETAEKQLLIQLADRNLISVQTLQERFKEDPSIEKIRIQKEMDQRESGTMPPQTSPYHNPDKQHDLEKMALQKDIVNPEDVGVKTTKTKQEIKKIVEPKQAGYKPVGTPKDGRPKHSTDKKKRKSREIKPAKGSIVMAWAKQAQKTISEKITPALLLFYQKSNLRKLTDTESRQLEKMKFAVLSHLSPQEEITDEVIHECLAYNYIDEDINAKYLDLIDGVDNPDIEFLRMSEVIAYSNYHTNS